MVPFPYGFRSCFLALLGWFSTVVELLMERHTRILILHIPVIRNHPFLLPHECVPCLWYAILCLNHFLAIFCMLQFSCGSKSFLYAFNEK
jgi:hypothetical protein